ncbi:hypothetical protein [Aurantimonas marina]|uniref:hypothetical protein n=1 Tax=Aurantimonas marina TaxID=2780508 RepID=UPI0019D2566F|nr:hypothetical protein [Aurantimonas marina]
MPSIDDIVRFFSGAALLMAGRSEGLKRLDLSADGFWQSFSAIVVALPPIALSWIEFESVQGEGRVTDMGPVAVYGAHALADVLAWMLPILVLMLVAKPIGYSRKIVPLVVATNWGGAMLAWAFAPYWLIVLLVGMGAGTALLGGLVTIASITLTARLIFFATGKDIGGAVAVTVLMIVGALVSYGAVMDVTGIALI